MWGLKRDKWINDSGITALPKILKAYIDDTTLLSNPTRSILGNYTLGCCSVVLATL